MTLSEFKAWLDGYLAAGGDDMAAIKEKLDATHETPSFDWGKYVVPPSSIPPFNPNDFTVTCKTVAQQ